jgi:hypothetical protein
MATNLLSLDNLVVKDVIHRDHHQISSNDAIQHLDSHVRDNVANLSASTLVSAGAVLCARYACWKVCMLSWSSEGGESSHVRSLSTRL